MLTRSSVWWLIFALKISYPVGSTPYFWNKKSKRMEFVETSFRKVVWAIHNLLYGFYELYVLVRWVHVAFIQESPATPPALGALYVLITYNVTFAIQLSLLRNYGQHHIWINSYLDYFYEYQRRQAMELPTGKKAKKRGYVVADISRVMLVITTMVFVIFLLDVASVFQWPAAPFFTSSVMTEPMSMTFVQIAPFACFHIYIWTHQWFTILFYAVSMLCYIYGVKNTVNHLRFRVKAEGFGARRDNLESTLENNDGKAFADEYRRFQLMQLYTNKLWATTNLLYEIVVVIGSILAFYGSLRLEGVRALHQLCVGTLAASTLVYLLKNMSQVYETSVKLLEGWKQMLHNKWFRKFFRSSPPPRMNIGSFYFADRELILTIMQIIMGNTCSLIMSTTASRSSENVP